MDDNEIKKRIDKYLKEICHYSQMQVFATSQYQKRYLQYQIDGVANELFDLFLVGRDYVMQPQQIKSPVEEQMIQTQTGQIQSEQQQQIEPHPVQSEQQQPIVAQPQTGQQQPIETQPQSEQQQPIVTQPQSGQQQPQQTLPVITLEQLAQNDGGGGKPAYVAVNGNVYDVSMMVGWAGGTHFGLFAGRDLTSEFVGCHRGMMEVLQRTPIIGVLEKK